MSEANIKIMISCHKPSDYVNNEIFCPVQVGCALRETLFPDMLHDHEGENISETNPRFCELTAQYYAWKNVKADYYGFFHYRRYFCFNEQKKKKYDIWGNLIEQCIDEEAIRDNGWDEKTISELVQKYDLILPEIKDITKMPGNIKSNREQYLSSGYLHKEDLDIMMDVLGEKYPAFVPYAQKYLDGHETYLNNMFIMKKSLFETYSKWAFDILLECDKRIDFTDYSVEAIRTPGHLAERLVNIFVLYLKDHKKCRIKELPTVAILDTDPVSDLKPAYSENNTAIALSANDYYVPYVATLLQSMVENSEDSHNYDIIIMNKDISKVSEKHLQNVIKDHANFTLRFLNVSRYGKQFEHIFLRGHFVLETYFRLLMPEILKNYQKVLYMDSDLVVNADVAELYATDVEGYLLAACHDADTAGLYNGFEPKKKEYMDKVLKIEKPYEYFQAGVILFNLDEFRKTYTVTEMLEFATSYQWELLDQDVLNYLAQGKAKIVDMRWNVMTDWRRIRIPEIISRAPKYLRDEYMAAHEDPYIIHYAGPDKPWQQPSDDYADVFWAYARKTVYYEVMMQRLAQQEARAMTHASFGDKVKKTRLDMINKAFPYETQRRENLDRLYTMLFKH